MTAGFELSGNFEEAAGIGGLLAMEKLDGTKAALAFLYDGNGNVGQLVRLTDNALRSRYHYDPYGNAVYSYDPYANACRFSTKPLDTIPGAYYFGYGW